MPLRRMSWNPSLRRSLTVRQEWMPKPIEESAATAGRAAATQHRARIVAITKGGAFFHVLAIVVTSFRADGSSGREPGIGGGAASSPVGTISREARRRGLDGCDSLAGLWAGMPAAQT